MLILKLPRRERMFLVDTRTDRCVAVISWSRPPASNASRLGFEAASWLLIVRESALGPERAARYREDLSTRGPWLGAPRDRPEPSSP